MGTTEIFLNRTPMACALRSRIDKWDLIKLKIFFLYPISLVVP
ncbi:Retrovirus-related Pol polyprotein LINE-1 [Trichinella pseudospiralis]|uniref:Retrovirus-related Pol polyprotein LINE-1 n=1 Tax=Trichinella pseudospiralis TaxID=6337 RepID=A0A0V1GBI5_TRIPS|nr:Retrovirus-related Pol polyprotein LINE-1 [Trichinella pseudospiralis]